MSMNTLAASSRNTTAWLIACSDASDGTFIIMWVKKKKLKKPADISLLNLFTMANNNILLLTSLWWSI